MEAIVLWIAHRLLLLLLVAVAIFSGCSTPMMSLQSTPPKAQLFASQLGASGPKLVGETPISLPAASVQTGASGPVLIEFRKAGYVTKTLVVTDLSAGDLA